MKKTIILFAAFIGTVSCSDFLNETQTTGLQTSTYQSESMLESNIYGIISSFSGTWGINGEPFEFFSEASGLTHWGGNTRLGKPKWDSTLKFTQYSTNEVNDKYFRTIFKGIECCNVLISNLPSSPVDEEYKRQIEAEACFYRAVLYFNAVRIWGALPLRTEPVTAENSTNCPRSSVGRIYEQIVADLKYAAEYMRTPEQVTEHYDGVPRPDKYAPVAYLSSVYATIGSLLYSPDDNFWKPENKPDFSALGVSDYNDAYEKALDYAESLIAESGKRDAGCAYSLVPNYADLFNYDGNPESPAYRNPEQILTLSYAPNSVTGRLAWWTLYSFVDGTKDNDESITVNGNYGRFRPNRFVYQRWCKSYPGVESDTYPGMYLTCKDPRMNVSLYHGSIKKSISTEETEIYPLVIKNSKSCVYPFFRKYWSSDYNRDNGTAGMYLMRFAEVYFNAAEAAAALGQEGKAFDYMEVVHKRARGTGELPKWEAGQFATKDSLLSAIFWERIFEFYGEGHEWNEVHRHGATWIADNIAAPKNEFLDRKENKQLRTKGSDHSSFEEGFYYITDPQELRRSLLAAFPNSEFLYNSGISYDDQNDFYFE